MPQLATRLRPQVLEDIIGQTHLTGPNGVLTAMMRAKTLFSMILYGPPGTGKTSIAHALSGSSGVPFEYFNASTDPKKKLQKLAEEASPNKPLIILLDEIHRLDKPKQDFLLPYIEDGSFVIVGATTENPYINVTPALRSRSQILQVHPLSPDDIDVALERGLEILAQESGANIELDPLAKELLMTRTNGDVRHALNALEFAFNLHDLSEKDIKLTQENIENVIQQRAIDGDKDGDAHYDLLSAFQKSIRGSDADAAIHYLARLLEAGDLISACRRLIVIAFEDIGLADPSVWAEVIAATEAAQKVGLPEATIPLSAITTKLALSPKSNTSYKAYAKAAEDLNNHYDLTIPSHLKDTHYKGSDKLGHVGYIYPHDYPRAMVKQQYLPDDLASRRYIEFPDQDLLSGKEKTIENISRFVNKRIKP